MPCPAVPSQLAIVVLTALVVALIVLSHRYVSHQFPAITPGLAKGKSAGKLSLFLTDIHSTAGFTMDETKATFIQLESK